MDDQPSQAETWSVAALDQAWSHEEDLETLLEGREPGSRIQTVFQPPRFDHPHQLPEQPPMIPESAVRPTQPDRSTCGRRLTHYGLLASLLCILASGAMWFWQSGPPLPTAQAAHSTANSLPVDVPADPIRITKKIEDLRLGDWVLAKNPQLELEEAELETDIEHPKNLRALSLRLLKNDSTWLYLELLRTVEWVEENQRDGKVYVFLEELGIDGWAELLADNPCPKIEEKPHPDCRLLTGRFIHQAANAFDLTVVDNDGNERTRIGVTGNHPVWSEDRQDFVRVDTLEIGEHLRDTQDSLLRVGSIEPRAGPEKVYNLEVDVEHVYFVSAAGLLVHNSESYTDGGGPKKADDFLKHGTKSDQTVTTKGLDLDEIKKREFHDPDGFSLTPHDDIADGFANNPLRPGEPTVIGIRPSTLEKRGIKPVSGTGLTDAGEVKILPEDFHKIRPGDFEVLR